MRAGGRASLNVVNAIQATILCGFYSNLIGTFVGTISRTSSAFGRFGLSSANLWAENFRFVYLNVVNAIQATIFLWILSKLDRDIFWDNILTSSTFGEIGQFMGQKLPFY